MSKVPCFSFYAMEDLPFDPLTLTRDNLQGVGFGLTSEVGLIKGTKVVAKISAPQDIEDQKAEKRVYERLQKHPNVLVYFGQSPQSCTLLRGALLFEYHSHGSLVDCLDKLKDHPGRSRFVDSSKAPYTCFSNGNPDGQFKPPQLWHIFIPKASYTPISASITSSFMTTAESSSVISQAPVSMIYSPMSAPVHDIQTHCLYRIIRLKEMIFSHSVRYSTNSIEGNVFSTGKIIRRLDDAFGIRNSLTCLK